MKSRVLKKTIAYGVSSTFTFTAVYLLFELCFGDISGTDIIGVLLSAVLFAAVMSAFYYRKAKRVVNLKDRIKEYEDSGIEIK